MNEPRDTEGSGERAKGVTGDLESRIASARRSREAGDNRSSARSSGEMTGLARGLRIGSEFVAAILVGAGLGYLIDLGLGSSPWGMLILFAMGFAAGILNVIRAVTEMNAAAPVAPPGTGTGPDDKTGKERNETR
ncbi:AtpZ/AtpI family protein [Devosia pacifica]|nr:AtpZ/AtpI family protein [Devosia pacifica]